MSSVTTSENPLPNQGTSELTRVSRHFRQVVLFSLMALVSISPKINIGVIGQEKTVDIRFEDILIGLVVLGWLVHSERTPLPIPTLLFVIPYILVSMFATAHGAVMGWIDPVRGFFFLAKEIEYFVFFLVGYCCTVAVEDLKAGVAGLLAGNILNGIFLSYQFATGDYVGTRYGYYGVALIGEPGPFVVGAYSGVMVFIGVSLLDIKNLPVRLVALFCMIIGAGGIIGSASRVCFVGILVAGVCWVGVKVRQGMSVVKVLATVNILALLVVVSVFVYYEMIKSQEVPVRRLTDLFREEDLYEAYARDRIEPIFRVYFDAIGRSPLTGNGKSITGISLPREAHNYYLRLLAETGVVGLLMFLFMIGTVLFRSLRISAGADPWERVMGTFCFLYTVFLLVGSIAQDAFIPVLTAELYWLSVGMTFATPAACHRQSLPTETSEEVR